MRREKREGKKSKGMIRMKRSEGRKSKEKKEKGRKRNVKEGNGTEERKGEEGN